MRRPSLSPLLLLGLLAAAPACGSDDSGATPSEHDAGGEPPGELNPMAEAYTALEAADYDAVSDVIDHLDAAFLAAPQAGRLAFYAGTMRLWRATGSDTRTVQEVLDDVLTAIDKLEQAVALRPEDPHANAFLGISQVVLGGTINDAERIETGRDVLANAVPFYPPYLHGVRSQAFLVLPRDHAYFPESVEAIYETLEACGYTQPRDADFDVTYPAAESNPEPTCWNSGVVDHVWEGIFLIFGDILVKNGEPERALELYATAKQAPNYDTWLFGDELDARMDSAAERSALYLDEDPANDPLTWVQGHNLCVGCHASKP